MSSVQRVLLSVAGLVAFGFVGCPADSPTEPTPPPCQYTLSPISRTFAAEGGADFVTIATAADCAWSASAGAPWISLTGTTSGTGNGTVPYGVSANPNEGTRAGKITIAGVVVAILQDGRGPCTYDVSPTSSTFPSDGGSATIHITAAAPCDWTASAADAWLTIVTGAVGHGTGEVSYTVARHSGTSDRTGAITAAGVLVQILQLAPPIIPPPPPPPGECSYSVAPTEFTLHWHQTGGEITLTTTGGCTWAVSPDAEWLTLLTAPDGSGASVIRFGTSTHTEEATRRAPLKVRWRTPTAGQNVWITQEGCYYAVAPNTASFTAAGGNGSAVVFGDPVSTTCAIGCPWNAVSNADWIHVTSGMPRAGDDQFLYRVDANTSGQNRTGTIRIERVVLTITQSGAQP